MYMYMYMMTELCGTMIGLVPPDNTVGGASSKVFRGWRRAENTVGMSDALLDTRRSGVTPGEWCSLATMRRWEEVLLLLSPDVLNPPPNLKVFVLLPGPFAWSHSDQFPNNVTWFVTSRVHEPLHELVHEGCPVLGCWSRTGDQFMNWSWGVLRAPITCIMQVILKHLENEAFFLFWK